MGLKPERDGLEDFFQRQVKRIHRNTKRALKECRARRGERLKAVYDVMEAEHRLGHATGGRKPDLDGNR